MIVPVKLEDERKARRYTDPDSFLLRWFGRVVGTQALRVIAVMALIAL